MNLKNLGKLAGLIVISAGAFLPFALLVPSDSQCATCACPPMWCESEDGARARKQKKAAAIRMGLPERLAALYDRLPPCRGCVETSPDWPHIGWRYDADAYEEKFGRPPPYDGRSLTWTRDLEQKLRQDMRDGIVSKMAITIGVFPCRCCPELDEDGNMTSDRTFFEQTPGYDAELDVHADAAILYTDPAQLGPEPTDLTELPASFARPDELRFPRVNVPTPIRVVQAFCPDCRSIADEYNELAREVDEDRRLRARRQRDSYIVSQVIDNVWRELEGVGQLATTPATDEMYDELMSELGVRQEDLIRNNEKIKALSEKIAEGYAKLDAIMARLKRCEDSCKESVEQGRTLIGDDGRRSLYVPGGRRPITGSCPECTGIQQQYNDAVAAANDIRQRLLGLAQRYLDEPDARPGISAEHEQALANFLTAEAETGQLRQQLDDCESRCRASGERGDLKLGDDGTPFGQNLPGNDAADALAGTGGDGLAGAMQAACGQYGSVPADTIACSVHTFKKPDLGSTNPDVSVGEPAAVPGSDGEGGGYDTEVFVRNPDDNNLRQGCGDDLTAILAGNPPLRNNPEVRINWIACNQIADNGKDGKRVIIRKHRDQVNVDTSDRRKADYFREEDQRFTRSGPSTLHLTVRNTVNDAVQQSPNTASCPQGESDTTFNFSDPKFSAVPGDIKTAVDGALKATGGDENIDVIKGTLQAIDGIDGTLGSLGTEIGKFHQASQAAQLGLHLAETTVNVQSGEGVTTGDLKTAAELASEITGNATIGKVAEGFDLAMKLQEIDLKQQQGINIETSDITELVDKLDTLRGDRFDSLGEVLGGIKTNAERIENVEGVIEDIQKLRDFVELAQEGVDDPVKAFEAFAEYLDMLSGIAGKVPGMGEFVEKYAEAVKLMQKDVETIAAAVERTNEAIRQADEAIGGYDYDSLLQDLGEFEEDLEEGGGGGQRLNADEMNLADYTSDERNAMDEARDRVRRLQDCIRDCTARRKALLGLYAELREEYRSLPSQAQLDLEYEQAIFQAVFQERFAAAEAAGRTWQPTAEDAARMGADSVEEARDRFDGKDGMTGRQASEAIDAARHRQNFRENARKRAKDMRDELARIKKKLEDCEDDLETAQRDYWQAVRDFTAEYSYWRAFIDNNYSGAAAAEARANALTELDRQIVQQGYLISAGTVEIIVVTKCEEDGTIVSVE